MNHRLTSPLSNTAIGWRFASVTVVLTTMRLKLIEHSTIGPKKILSVVVLLTIDSTYQHIFQGNFGKPAVEEYRDEQIPQRIVENLTEKNTTCRQPNDGWLRLIKCTVA